MTQTKDVVIRVQTLSGAWESLGSDRARGVWPEDDSYTSDHWGASKASFNLRRDPGAMWPDIGAFTPVDVEIGGVLVWSGFVAETPTSQSSRVINVQCKGWQFHLDDDVYQRAYLHTKMADYKDLRGVQGALLGATALNAAGQVTVDGGQIYLGWSNGTILGSGATAAAFVDLGSADAKRVVITWESSNNTPDMTCSCVGSSVATNNDGAGAFETAFSFALNAFGASGQAQGTFTTTKRYIKFYLVCPVGFTTGADHYWKITSVQVFADAAWESGYASILKATDIIPDALDRATILLSDDRSDIDPDATVTFNFPEFALDGQKTPREVLSACNAVHDYMLKIDARRRPIFKPKPSAPFAEIGEWPGSSVDDASANSGEEIYNRVVVEGTAADGEKISVERSAIQQSWAALEPITTPAPDNPSFTVDAASWTATGTGSSITRDVLSADTAPAGGAWRRPAGALLAGMTLSTTFTGTFTAQQPYVLTLRLRPDPFIGTSVLTLQWGVTGDNQSARVVLGSGFRTYSIAWVPSADRTGVTLTLTAQTAGFNVDVDTLLLYTAKPTLVDRRGFKRTHILPVKASLTTELADQIGDVWLAAHKTTPFKGTARIEGDRAAREITTGASIPPEQFLLRTGELLRLADRIDPDTGGMGRDGRIAEVTYVPADDAATVTLDSRRTSHEALLERLAIVVGGG